MNQALKIAIAEDEPMNLRRLMRLLEDCGCEVVATFGNGLALEEWMHTHPAVDALFLDIQMPGLDGLSLRASLDSKLPVVFVTAHAEHAVQAFDLEVVDFLLKPVTTERLVKALDRVRRSPALNQGRIHEPAAETAPKAGRYPVQAGGGVLFLDLVKTLYFEVEEQVVWAFSGERFRTKWKSLGEVEAFFPDAGLLRIHRHLLIRPESVLGLRSTGCGARVMVRLPGGIELEASRGATPKLKERLGLD
jgi:two-component system LytT family response regulator/two-component system response regulator AlgR